MSAIKLFQSDQLRSGWKEEDQKWYLSTIDVIKILSVSPRPRKYRNPLKTKLEQEGREPSHKLGQSKMKDGEGKLRVRDVAIVEQLLHLIQCILSPKVDPFFCNKT